MKREQVHFFHELLMVAGNHAFIMMFPLTIIGMFPVQSSYMVLWGALVLLPLVFYWIRDLEKRSFLFAVWHFPVAVLCVLIPVKDIVARVCVVLLVVFYMGMSFYNRLHKEDAKDGICHPVLPFVVGTVLMYVQNKHGNAAFVDYYLWLTVIFYICYILSYYLKRYLFFVVMNEKTAEKVPEKEILGSGLGYVLLFAGGSAACMLLSINVTFLDRIVQMMKAFMGYFVGVLLRMKEPKNDIGAGAYSSMEVGDPPLEEMLPPGRFWIILEKVMYVILAVLFVVVVVAVVRQIICMLMYGFTAGGRKAVVTLQSHEDIREKIAPEKKKATSKGSVLERLSYRGRIRATYKRVVTGQKNRLVGEKSVRVLSFFTAKQCCDEIGRDGLREAYEKARYSDMECTREDISKSKN